MSLDPTAREANVRDSIKKFFVDNIRTIEGIYVSFDRYLSAPKIQGKDTNRWVSVHIGPLEREFHSTVELDVYCCTRIDSEGFRLAQLCDNVMGYLTDSTMSDGMKRITFYQSRPSGAWTELGAFKVIEINESPQLDATDQTKYKVLTVTLSWGATI